MRLVDGIRKLFTRARAPGATLPQERAMLDGVHAVATLEMFHADCCAYRAGSRAGGEELAQLARHEGRNLLGAKVRVLDAASPLAAALGEAVTGARSAAFVDAEGLVAELGTLSRAVAWRVPMVVHVVARASGLGGPAPGTGHEALHAVADTGAVVLHAADVQDAVDLTLFGRRLAESALLPVVVALDAETATTLDHVDVPTRDAIATLLGAEGDGVPSATPTEEMLFGDTRRRVPRRVDLDRVGLLGAPLEPSVAAASAVALRELSRRHVEEHLDRVTVAYAGATGRDVGPVFVRGDAHAKRAFVGHGAALGVATRAAAALEAHAHEHAAVIGLRCLRPFPSLALAEALRGKESLLVLEATDSPLAGEPPLARELRGAVLRSLEGGKTPRHVPRIRSAILPIGGASPSVAELAAAMLEGAASVRVLGVGSLHHRSVLPKRQAMLDRLRRAYPDASPSLSGAQQAAAAPRGFVWAVARTGEDDRVLAEDLNRVLGVADATALVRPGWRRDAHQGVALDVGELGDGERPRALPDDLAPRVCLVTRGAALEALPEALRDAVLVVDREADAADAPVALDLRGGGGRTPRVLAVTGGAAGRRHRLLGAALAALREAGALHVEERKLVRAFEGTVAVLLPEGERAAASEAFEAGLHEVTEVELVAAPRRLPRDPAPAVREVAARESGGDVEVSLTRFHGTTSALYQRGLEAELAPDPFVASGILPPMTAAFAEETHPPALPSLDAPRCTGCGVCWTTCPDGAIAVAALAPRALLEVGMARGKAEGASTDALRPVLGKLATRTAKACLAAASGPADVAALFAEAREAVDGDAEASSALAASVESLAPLRVVRTEHLFRRPETAQKGAGQVLALAVDPDRCKGCGLCIAECPEEALARVAPEPEVVERLRRERALVEALPDTPGATVAEAMGAAETTPLAAILLSRHAATTLVGVDGVEAGSGAKIALRAALAVGEYERQRDHRRLLAELVPLRDRLSATTRELLGAALPEGDVVALAEGLERVDETTVSLVDLGKRLEGLIEEKRIDVTRLKRLTDAGRAIADMEWRLEKGALGLGRARLSLALTSDGPLAGLVRYPYNPLVHPAVAASTRELSSLSLGLVSAHIERTLEVLRVLRLAHLELESPAEAVLAADALRGLSYEDLTPEERRHVPPVLVVGDDRLLESAELPALLDAEWPLKVLVLSAADHVSAARPPTSELALLGYGRGGVVAQGSVSEPAQLFRALSLAMASPGPALLRVHCPSPSRDGIATDGAVALARAAVATRLSPLFLLDPGAEGVFGARLDLGQNPAPEARLGGDATAAAVFAAMGRHAHAFGPVPEAKGASPLAVASYLDLGAKDRQKHLPVVDGPDGVGRVASPAVVRAVEERQRTWQALQELAGVATPFTGAVQEQVEAALRAAHEAALASQRAELEQRMAQIAAQREAELALRLRDSLVALAGRARAGTLTGATDGSAEEGAS